MMGWLLVGALWGAPGGATPGSGGSHVVEDLQSKEAAAQWIAVAPRALANALEPLAEHRLKSGMVSVAIVPWEAIHDPKLKNGLSDQLRSFSREMARRGGAKYLLIVGDAATIPPLTIGIKNSPVCVSDAGFVSDGDSGIPDRAIGRIPTSDEATVRAIVERTITYETDTRPGGWRRRVNFLAASGGFGAAVDSTIDGFVSSFLDQDLPAEFDLRVLRPTTDPPFGVEFGKEKEQILDLFNSGSLISIYAGHGSRHGLHTAVSMGLTRPILLTPDVERVGVRNGSPFVILFACDTGQFGAAARGGAGCLAQSLFTNPKGAMAVFAASENSHPYPDMLMAHGMNERFRKSPDARIGDLVLAAKKALGANDGPFREKVDKIAGLFGLADGERDRLRQVECAIYNLFGDPATKLARPGAELSLRIPQNASVGDSISVEADASVADGASVTWTLEVSRASAPLHNGYPAVNDRVLAQAAGEMRGGQCICKFKIPKTTAKRLVVVADMRGEGRQSVAAAGIDVVSKAK